MRNKKLLLIIILGFTLRILLFIFFAPWNLDLNKDIIFFGDANGYHLLAISILKYFSFADNQLRTPIYPAFISFFYFCDKTIYRFILSDYNKYILYFNTL